MKTTMKKVVLTLVACVFAVCVTSCSNNAEPESSSYWDLKNVGFPGSSGCYYVNDEEVLSFECCGSTFWLTLPEGVEGETVRVEFCEYERGNVGPYNTEWKRTSDNKRLFVVSENHEWVYLLWKFLMKSNGYVKFEVINGEQVTYEINIPTRDAILQV